MSLSVLAVDDSRTIRDMLRLTLEGAGYRMETAQDGQDGLEVLIDSTDKKVSIKNDQVSLLGILNDLATLLKQLKVYTPAGPSGTPLPDTIAAIQQLEVDYKQLIK